MSLSRDIYRWMQSLALSYSVRNTRRDFANGFLIAEILCRYHPKDIEMHSFDNGTSLARRRDNWQQLERFFVKTGFEIDRTTINNIIHCKGDAAVAVVERIYTFLTNKTVKSTRHLKQEMKAIPPFARPTASALIKGRMKEPDLLSTIDQKARDKEAYAVLNQHARSMREERAVNPERFQSHSNRTGGMIHRVENRTLGTEEQKSLDVAFQQPQVKTVDDESIHQMRAARRRQLADPNNRSPHSSNNLMSNSTMGVGSTSLVVKPSVEILNAIIHAKLNGNPLAKKFDPRKDVVACFVESLGVFPDALAAEIVQDMIEKAASLCAENCLASPKEFWSLFSLFLAAFTRLDTRSLTYTEVVRFLVVVGNHMVEKDQYIPFALLTDFGLPSIIAIIKSSPNKIEGIGHILYAYSFEDPEEHRNVIRTLRDGLNDSALLLRVLTVLITLETEFNPKSLDLYFYFLVAGLKHANPNVRACAVNMLATVAMHPALHAEKGERHVLHLWDRLTPLLDDTWQVQAQLALVSTAVLSRVFSNSDDSKRVTQVLDALLAPSSNPLVLLAATWSLPRCFDTHPSYRDVFSKLLTNPDIREHLDGKTLAITPTILNLPPVPAFSILESIAIQSRDLDNLNPDQVDLLHKVISSIERFPSAEVAAKWLEQLEALKTHLVAELCDPQQCDKVIYVIQRFVNDQMTHVPALKLLTSGEISPMLTIFPHMFGPDGNPTSKDSMLALLENWAQVESSRVAVQALLSTFARMQPRIFNASPLPQFAQSYGIQI